MKRSWFGLPLCAIVVVALACYYGLALWKSASRLRPCDVRSGTRQGHCRSLEENAARGSGAAMKDVPTGLHPLFRASRPNAGRICANCPTLRDVHR
jgi:hypothetical protein